MVAALVRWAPRNASVTGEIVFICAGWTITVPIVETIDTDSAIAVRASKVEVKTIAIPDAANIWTHASLTVPIFLISTCSWTVADVVVHKSEW